MDQPVSVYQTVMHGQIVTVRVFAPVVSTPDTWVLPKSRSYAVDPTWLEDPNTGE